MAADFLRGLKRPPSYKCCICMEFYGSEPSTRGILEHAIELPCKHIVGSECIEMWLSPDFANRNTCPVCRHQFFPGQPRPYMEHGILGDDDFGSEDRDEEDVYPDEEDVYPDEEDMYPDEEDSDSNDNEEEDDQEEEEEEEEENEGDKEMADEEEDEEEVEDEEDAEDDDKEMAEEDDSREEQENQRQQIQPLERLPGGEPVQLAHGRWEQEQHEHQRHVFHTEEYRLDANSPRLPIQQLQQPKQLYLPHVRGQDQPFHHYLPPQSQQPEDHHRHWYHRELQLHHHRQQQQASNEEGQSQEEVSIDLDDDGRSTTGDVTKDTSNNTTLPNRVKEWQEAVMAYLLDNEAETGTLEAVKQLNRSRDQLLYMQLVDVTHPNPVTAQGIVCLSTEQEDELFKALDQRGAFQDFIDVMPDLPSTRDLWNALRERGFNYYNVFDDEEEVYRDEWRLSSESTSWECLYGNVCPQG